MIGYSAPAVALNYGTVNYFIPIGSQNLGTNAVIFDNSVYAIGTDGYKLAIDNNFSVCPINFIIFNDSSADYNQCRFLVGGQDFNSNVNFEAGRYTILYPIDKPKVNHSHVDSLLNYLGLTFDVTTIGNLNIIVNYMYFQ
jgi:hypothetical protein